MHIRKECVEYCNPVTGIFPTYGNTIKTQIINDEKQAAKTIKQQHDITKFLMNFPRKTTLSSELLPTEQHRDDVTVVPVMLQCTLYPSTLTYTNILNLY